jgi:cysteine desulfurase
MSLTAHKFYGPKGTGALYIRSKGKKVHLVPYIVGGGHEMGRRSGTLNVPGIVGFSEAIELATKDIEATRSMLLEKRAALLERIVKIAKEENVEFIINGPEENLKLPNNLSLSFSGIDASTLHSGLRLIAFSTGSACSTANAAPSHVLKAIGLSDELAKNTIRFSVGKPTTEKDLDVFSEHFQRALSQAKVHKATGLNI